MATKEQLRIGNRRLELSNLDKIFYPETGFTKGDMVVYYRAIAPVVLPYLKGRPVTLKRYPDGVTGNFFYEKRCPPHRPEWVGTIKMRRHRDDKDVEYCAVDSVAALVWAANMGNLELHSTLARLPHLDRPTAVVFDLDPGPPAGILDCAEIATRLRDLLDELSLKALCKTSGSKGMQLYVPLNTKVTYEDTAAFALTVATQLATETPGKVVTKMKKELRTGKVLIDWSQNDGHKTTVCAYSLRARPRPTVSTPVTWEEIGRARQKKDPDLLTFEFQQVLNRIEKHEDIFGPVRKLRQRLPKIEA
ncbi:MAG: bifunctional non-ous end joining protein LigD [Actinomycetota bacterium]|jgi:bifunctional non-homologous end joining protein LigD|nr:bifunctional non-ous end joining protein LigD [Actinomycetota bacterium]